MKVFSINLKLINYIRSLPSPRKSPIMNHAHENSNQISSENNEKTFPIIIYRDHNIVK